MPQGKETTSSYDNGGANVVLTSSDFCRITDNGPHNFGVSFSNLDVYGTSEAKIGAGRTIATCLSFLRNWSLGSDLSETDRRAIIRNVEGILHKGEMLLVLGRPGSGCTTLLKVLSGNTKGYRLGDLSRINCSYLRGQSVYCAEDDVHFPDLNVRQTLTFAAEAKVVMSRNLEDNIMDNAFKAAEDMVKMFDLGSCLSTKIGSQVITGVSGGEKKRVSLAEVMMCNASLQCWDGSTSGLDSETSLRFIRNVRNVTRKHQNVAIAALCQVSEEIYNSFDKVLVLHEGAQTYFGPTGAAAAYFESLGFARPHKVTTSEFLLSTAYPSEAFSNACPSQNECSRDRPRPAHAWSQSLERAGLLQELQQDRQHDDPGPGLNGMNAARARCKSPPLGTQFPYTRTVSSQLRNCIHRGCQRLMVNLRAMISMAFGNFVLAIIIGSVFYNLPDDIDSLLRRSILLFYIITVTAFLSASEVAMIWEHRPIMEKQKRYGFHYPFVESLASIICDIPSKIVSSLAFISPIYLLSNLRRSAEAFFVFYVFSFLCLLTLSMFFRMAGSFSRSIVQSIVPVGVSVSVFVIYSGFILPSSNMVHSLSWIRFINPLYFTFESVMINEFGGRHIECKSLNPDGLSYERVSESERLCSSSTTSLDSRSIFGDEYLTGAYDFNVAHLWRNFGILAGLMLVFCCVHLLASEFVFPSAPKTSRALPYSLEETRPQPDPEPFTPDPRFLAFHKDSERIRPSQGKNAIALHWQNITCQIVDHKARRSIIENISGFIRRGEVTALMGITGAGKTTLLNALAHRTNGQTSGDILCEGNLPGRNFQRIIGYAQQQDIHLHTATIREALIFSARLRRCEADIEDPSLDIVEEVMDVLELHQYADTVIGHLGEGLDMGQRKRLTVAIEVVAQSSGILFLDEPTSNLDSHSAWMICRMLRRLACRGCAILCTIHQPSPALLPMFDQILLLGSGGRQLYFGELGDQAKTMVRYFENAGARCCRAEENPAEWVLQVTTLPPECPGADTWANVWDASLENSNLRKLLEVAFKNTVAGELRPDGQDPEFAVGLRRQYLLLAERTFQELWRSPSYIWSKFGLCCGIALFVGVSLIDSRPSLQGLQSQLFSIFLILTIGNSGMKQIIHTFDIRRKVFESREGPSKIYSWKAFVLVSITAELPWQTLSAFPVFLLWYFPTGFYKNYEGTERVERAVLLFLSLWAFLVFMATFALMIASGIKQVQTSINIAVVFYQLTLLFCGVLAAPRILPRFWIFMYRLSPLNYLVSSMMSATIADMQVNCLSTETIKFQPPSGLTCADYMSEYLKDHEGYLLNPTDTMQCQFCPWTSTNSYLQTLNIQPQRKWINFTILVSYVFVNIILAMGLYRLSMHLRRARK